MLQKQAEKNYLCSLTDKRKTMKHTNPQVEQMTSFIVMDVLERANELQKQGVDVIHLEVGEPDLTFRLVWRKLLRLPTTGTSHIILTLWGIRSCVVK